MNTKKNILLFISAICILFFPFWASAKEVGKSFFTPRPQGSNSAINIAQSLYMQQVVNCERNYNQFAVTLEYLESLNDKGPGEFLFFNGSTRMRFGNAGEPNIDIFSRNFFLNDDFDGVANINPAIENFTAHLYASYDLENLKKGFYLATHIPLVWTLWNLRLHESRPSTAQEGTYIPANALGNSFNRASPVKTIIAAWRGNTINTNSSPTNPEEDYFPDLKQRMHFATINGHRTVAAVGDIELTLGYNVVTKADAHFDIQGRVVIPTGNRPKPHFFFAPVAGSGKHAQIGFGITGHDDFITTECSTLGCYVEGAVYYMFAARQKRTFDITNNGIGSRYLLFKKFNAEGNYAHEILFGPNVTTLNCHVKSDFMTDVSVMLQYLWRNLNISFGYNFWARGKEAITLRQSIPLNTYGIQGKTTTNDNNTASRTLISGENATLIDPKPVFISNEDLNLSSAAHPLSASQKLFFYMGYAWVTHPYTPFLGMGIEGEVSVLNNTALQQIGIWAKGGITF